MTEASVENWLKLARAAEDAGNGEEAYGCYARVLEMDATRCDAWLGKARAAGSRSSLDHFPLEEMSAALARGIECAPSAREEETRAEGATILNQVAIAYHALSTDHLVEYVTESDSWRWYLERCQSVVRALELAHSLDPTKPVILENIVEVCSEQIKGVVYSAVGDYWIARDRRHGISASYEAELRTRIAGCAARLKRLRQDYEPPRVEKRGIEGGGPCFIVTATMGDPAHPDVTLIRRFRDDALSATASGRALIRAYAAVGPGAARVIRRSPALRRLSRTCLVGPLASLLRRVT